MLTSKEPTSHAYADGFGRQPHTQLRLDVKLKSQEQWSFAYSELAVLHLEAAGTLVLSFRTHTVRIEGRHLGALYERLLSHVVAYIKESAEAVAENLPWIRSIEVKPVPPKSPAEAA